MVKAKVDGGGSLVDSCQLQVARGCGQLQEVVASYKRLWPDARGCAMTDPRESWTLGIDEGGHGRD